METTTAPKAPQFLVVANTILFQMGGSKRLKIMIGAKDFIGDEKSVTFKFRKGKDGINAVTITLDPSDTYSVKFLKLRGLTPPKVGAEFSGVYCDQLIRLFETTTSLALRF